MSFKPIKNNLSGLSRFVHPLFVTLLVLLLVLFYKSAYGNEKLSASLQFDPEQCVSLQKGQNCYVTVDITWQASQVGDYCLFLANGNKPLECWQGEKQAEFSYDFSHNDRSKFQLKTHRGDEVLAEYLLEIAWVYKTKRVNSSWRMF